MGPLNSYARRVVHLEVAQDPELASESQGDGQVKLRHHQPARSPAGALTSCAPVGCARRDGVAGASTRGAGEGARGVFSTDDTIVAIATPAGRAGLGVVRISGPQSPRMCRAVCWGDGAPAARATRR